MSTDLPLVAPRDSVESVTLQDFAASVTSHQGSTGTQAAHYVFKFCLSLSIFCSGNIERCRVFLTGKNALNPGREQHLFSNGVSTAGFLLAVVSNRLKAATFF